MTLVQLRGIVLQEKGLEFMNALSLFLYTLLHIQTHLDTYCIHVLRSLHSEPGLQDK